MDFENQEFVSQIPILDLSEGPDMLTDFSREAQRHLISARNSLLVLESVPTDKEAIENIFKTFHTIKGLADFLTLQDICFLTNEAEVMLNMIRKNALSPETHLIELITTVIDSLQRLLELLDEQIANGGKLRSPYFDVTELVTMIRQVTSKKPLSATHKSVIKSIPTINFVPDMTVCSQIEGKIRIGQADVVVEKPLLEKLISEFQEASKGLKEAQSKLHERQRELIKERELAIKLTQQAQDEARAKSEYLANMSHEIRTLINAILGFTDLLKESALNDRQKEHLNTIFLSGRMLLEIVNNILDFSKVEAGKLKLEQIDFDLKYIVEEIFKIIRTRLNGKPIGLFYRLDDKVPLGLVGDPTRLKQIFLNLLDNAIKFTENGEIGIEVSLDQVPEAPQGEWTLRFVVHDSGIGIPEDKQKSIFESFTQAHESTTRLYGGTGLGLALVKNFIETMKGKIWVESQLGQGSKFIFTIKLRKAKAPPSGVDYSSVKNFAQVETLLVMQHQKSRESIMKLFDKAGLKAPTFTDSVKQASDILLGLEKENKGLPNVIFIDAMIPGKQGIMLAYKIRQQERYRKIKLIAVSSDVKLEQSQDFQQSGFDFLLAQPVIEQELLDTIQSALGERLKEQRVISLDMLHQISCAGIKVLVVEDSLPNQELLKVHFESLGCTCDYVSNGQEALDQFKKNTYDICFMDLQMPVMGGLEAAKFIRDEMKINTPIVALTAAEIQAEKDKCFEVGMNDYLPKPFDLDDLKRKIIKCTKM